jgi:uncharacterized FlaG/YvyC family protein
MNIKTVASNPILAPDPKSRISEGVRAQNSADRDANGKREQSEQETKQNLNDQEFKESMEILEEMLGLKSSELRVRVEQVNGSRMIYIEDASGRVVRRLTEAQLWLATRDKDRPTGAILDKAA